MASGGCIICGSDLIYLNESESLQCSICKETFLSNARCVQGHFICDHCHELDGFELIQQICLKSSSTNPVELANLIMSFPEIKMHGPEHHFLVPAVLITTYYNKTEKPGLISEKLNKARERAKNIHGGFCGFYGTCGAGVGTGIFMSLILNCTPLSKEEWKLSNLMTSKSLLEIANYGGPRCCKRDTFLSLETSVDFVEEHLNIKLDKSTVKCKFFERNKECKNQECKYYPG